MHENGIKRVHRLRAVLLPACLVLCTLLCAGCAGSASVTSSSPQATVAKATITSSSELTEASQLVDVCIPFDKQLSVDGDASSDFTITIDGTAIDTKTMQVSVSADGSKLHVKLAPTDSATGPDSGSYFACYQGQLAISSSNSSGALAHVKGSDGAAACLQGSVSLYIPSGMKLETVSQTAGSTTVRVEQFAQIRCCTWFTVGTQRFYMHHHLFSRETKASCARAFAQELNANLKGSYHAKASGSSVRIVGSGSAAGKRFAVKVLEGSVQ